jgi:hypothetical protein
MSPITWIKNNKLLTLALVVIAYFLLSFAQSFFGVRTLSLDMPSQKMGSPGIVSDIAYESPVEMGVSRSNYIPPAPDYTPQADVDERLVIQESNLSLLVKNVVEVRKNILDYTKTSGGYMVSSSVSNPQDAPTATVIIRIPSDKLDAALDYFHSLSVKVVSENLSGRDVTDQYVDIDARLKTLRSTKERFESILAQAVEIKDITNLTREILSVQRQIDSLIGQQESLKQNASLSKLTIYMSTDELALPYAPSETFRPNVIFKLAVRSLIGFTRSLATWAIWIGVYAVVWVPALILFIAIKRWRKKKLNPQKTAN